MSDRDDAILRARKMMEQEFVVLDTETTGLEHDDVAVQIGIVNRSGVILLDSYVKPWKPIPARATQLHGITNEMVQDAPEISAILPQLDTLLQGKTVLVYNVIYDKKILLQSAHAHDINWKATWFAPRDWNEPRLHPDQQQLWHCVMEWFAQFYGDWNDYRGNYRWQKLTTAASYFDIPTSGAHGAVADALMTLQVVEAMAKARLSEEAKL